MGEGGGGRTHASWIHHWVEGREEKKIAMLLNYLLCAPVRRSWMCYKAYRCQLADNI